MTGLRTSEHVAARLREQRERLQDAPLLGRSWCRQWSRTLDTALVELLGTAPHGALVTLVATGGTGREELCPESDVDLLLVHDDLEVPALEAVVRAVVYPLWDAKLKVGHAVRSRREVVAVALDDLDTATATLDGRVVAGAADRYLGARTQLLQRLAADAAPFLRTLAAADADRRARAGDAAEVLEPDLKSGAGALRDLQSLRWAAAALVGELGIDALVPSGHVGAADRGRLARAEDELLAQRVALHLTTQRPGDVLRLEVQQRVATRRGLHDGADDTDTAAHRLLAAHFDAARTVAHVHDRAWRRIGADLAVGRRRRRPASGRVEGFEIVDRTLRLPRAADPEDPTLPVRLLRALRGADLVLDRRTAALLREHPPCVADPWPDDLAAAFVGVLESGPDLLRIAAELDDVGWTRRLLPVWASLRARPQRHPFHRYSLDRHLLHTVVELDRLAGSDEWAATVAEIGDLLGAVRFGALLHDVGKPLGEPHTQTGVAPARAAATRAGLDAAGVEVVARLVELHLLLPEVATRRDLADPAEIAAVAERIGDRRLLSALHLLVAADGAATGPTAWTSWKASLVSELVRKAAAVLDDTLADDPASHSGTVRAALELAPQLGVAEEVVRDHLAALPEHYPAAVSPRAVVRHAGLADPRPTAGEIRTRVTPAEPTPDGLAYDELDVVAPDSPGLFARVSGVLALHGGAVVEAHAHTRADRTAVDTFRVARPEHATGSWWVQVEGDLVEAVAGRLAIRARVARKRAGETRRLARLPDVATRVTTSPDAGGTATVVEVHTLDRAGVLYRIAAALAELELDLVVAKVATLGHEVVDVFTVRDTTGAPLDGDHRRELELAIAASLAE